MKIIQVTIFCSNGRYKPVSTLLKVESVAFFNAHKREQLRRASTNICAKRGWTADDLHRLGYDKMKCRVYDEKKIAQENAERYERIKKERGWA